MYYSPVRIYVLSKTNEGPPSHGYLHVSGIPPAFLHRQDQPKILLFVTNYIGLRLVLLNCITLCALCKLDHLPVQVQGQTN